MIKSVKEISYADWLLIPDYENNRDVNKRMRKEHLKGTTTDMQHLVQIVTFKDENGIVKTSKIDGHSRTYAWERGQLTPKPETLWVVMHEVEGPEERYQLYKTIDSSLATESVKEREYTARLELGFSPESGLCQSAWSTALKLASKKASQEEALNAFLKEMKLIDDLELSPKKGFYTTGIKVAMLKSFKMNEDVAMLFWLEYDSEGTEIQTDLLKLTKEAGLGSTAQFMLSIDVIEIFEEYKNNLSTK